MTDYRRRVLDLLTDYTAIPSVVGNAPGLARMATRVADDLRARLGADIVEAGARASPSIVHARIDRGAAVTLLLYNMYDVMPADPESWVVPPFTGGVTTLASFGPCFVGRGAENNKGPLAGMIVALEALLAGGLEANLEILIEGQEESGSTALRDYLLADNTPVRRSGAALFPSFCEYGGGPPRLYCGSKGIAHGRIRATGPAAAIHSSNAPWIANPAVLLVEGLARLDALPELRQRIALSAPVRALVATLAESFDPDAELRFRASERFCVSGDGVALLTDVLAAVSLNVAELRTDPAGGRAIIPAAAEARFDLRTPPGIDPRALLAAMQAVLDGTEAVLTVEDAYPGHAFPPDHPAVRALDRTYRALGAPSQIWPWAIGAMPAYAFARVADVFLIGGLGRGGNAHARDEFVTLEGIDRFVTSLLHWLPATVEALRHG